MIFIITAVALGLAILVLGLFSYTQMASPFATTQFNENGLNVKVEYCQPKKKGRDIFGKLVPFDAVWRTGANWATRITLEQDTKIGEKEVKKGVYSLFTIPTAGKWTIIINGAKKEWGAFSYAKEQDVIRTEVESKTTDKSVESFTIKIEKSDKGANMLLVWDKTEVSVPISK